jgi:hypothetical protein
MYAPAASPCECGKFDWLQIVCGSSMGWGAVLWRRGARWRARAQAPSAWPWLARCTPVFPLPGAHACTLHDTACRFSSPALLSLETACSNLLFSLRIILFFFTYYLHNKSGSLVYPNHKVAMHASSGLMAGCVVWIASSWCESLWIGRSRRHAHAAPSNTRG